MHKMIEYVCEELDALEKKAAKGSMSAAEIEYADKLANLKKNLLKSDKLYAEMEEDGEYIGAMRGGMGGNMGIMGGSYARGSRGGNRGSNRGGSYEGNYEGSYARGDGRGRGSNARRDSMGRYSSERGYSRDGREMAEELRDLMEDAPDESVRSDLERIIRKVENM